MKAVKQSSIRKATVSKSKGAVRQGTSIRGSAKPRASQARPTVRSLTLGRSNQGRRETVSVKIPPILLEGDKPGAPSPLPRARAVETVITAPGSTSTVHALPEAYGTRRLKLTPRDPHWIHAHWDFTRQQLREANARSADGHLVLRTFKESAQGPQIAETHVHPESTRWMVHVPESGVRYAAELGFYNKRRAWSPLAASDPIHTPPAGASTDRRFEVATLTPEGKVQRHGSRTTIKPPPAQLGSADALHGNQPSSAGLRPDGSLAFAESSPGAVGGAPSSPGVRSWSSLEWAGSFGSPAGGAPKSPFRLEVNAELIVYGATQPDATLQVGDRTVPLNDDGTFRFRFALPDGAHDLPIKATASGTGEQRSAALRFDRHTDTQGHVESAPHEPGLKPPAAENL